MRNSGRKMNELREVSIKPHYNPYAEGSCLVQVGNTKVICTASVEDFVPLFRRRTGLGWVSAEYSMLPRSTHTRGRRDRGGNISGRTVEIQRLIGRTLRNAVDFARLGERQIIIDCDVLVADGGTRCASITGGWVALQLAAKWLLDSRLVHQNPITNQITAVSCGIVGGQNVLDLDYEEDSTAEVDGNFVMTAKSNLVEVQCSGEGGTIPQDAIGNLLELAFKGGHELAEIQIEAVSNASSQT